LDEELMEIVDKLLDMNPDPIPRYILLHEFKGVPPEKAGYEAVINHRFVKRIQGLQNSKGYWPPFHRGTENAVRQLLSYGIDKSHPMLISAKEYLLSLIRGEEKTLQFQKHDNIRWWHEVFVPLTSAATLSKIIQGDPTDSGYPDLMLQRKRFAAFVEANLQVESAKTAFHWVYDEEANKKDQNECFGFKTKQVIHPRNFYNLILLRPDMEHFLTPEADQALFEYCEKNHDGIERVYNKSLHTLVPTDSWHDNSIIFFRWLRALSLISGFRRWEEEEKMVASSGSWR
jgi:hypothetical protein